MVVPRSSLSCIPRDYHDLQPRSASKGQAKPLLALPRLVITINPLLQQPLHLLTTRQLVVAKWSARRDPCRSRRVAAILPAVTTRCSGWVALCGRKPRNQGS